MRFTVALALVLLGLPAAAQQPQPIPYVQTTTVLGGSVNASAVPSLGAPVFDLKNFVGPKKRTASVAIGSTVAFAMGQARARSRTVTPNFELIGSGWARGPDPLGGSFVGLGGGFIVPSGAVGHVLMLGSIDIDRGSGNTSPPLMNATVTDGLFSDGIALGAEGMAFKHVLLPPGAYSVTGNLSVSGNDNHREAADFRILVSLQYVDFATSRDLP